MTESTENKAEAEALARKQTYQTPELIAYGTIAELTKATSNIGSVVDGLLGPGKTS